MGINKSVPGIKNTVQNDVNWSFDEDFGILAFEPVVYNPTTCEIDRMVQPAVGAPTAAYSTNHLDDYTTTSVTYVGKEDSSGAWMILKLDETGNFPVLTYATISNNSTLTTYSDAWTARTTATYNLFSVAF